MGNRNLIVQDIFTGLRVSPKGLWLGAEPFYPSRI